VRELFVVVWRMHLPKGRGMMEEWGTNQVPKG
jgi:hypothetical protein